VIQQARTLTFELYPSMLDQLGLPETLKHYARQMASHVKTPIEVSDTGPELRLPDSLNCFLFRAAKELINNALKHGHASEIVVQVRRRPTDIRMLVSDDGRGFQPVGTVGPGLGLPWIRERVRCFGGTLDIESAPNRGTQVVIDLPVRARTPETEKEYHGEAVAG
jgi:two-component system sensor histidine kinase DegS